MIKKETQESLLGKPVNVQLLIPALCGFYLDDSYFHSMYREFSPNANFITANFVTAVFQNFLNIFCYCDFISILLMRFFG